LPEARSHSGPRRRRGPVRPGLEQLKLGLDEPALLLALQLVRITLELSACIRRQQLRERLEGRVEVLPVGHPVERVEGQVHSPLRGGRLKVVEEAAVARTHTAMLILNLVRSARRGSAVDPDVSLRGDAQHRE
jgi:hypothetical protein